MSFTKVTSAGIGSTELVTLDSLEVINNASIGGVLTYEDVTNVDSVGIITARAGVLVGSGITLSKDGDVFFTGIATGNGSGLTALNASNISSGTVPTARLGSGTASSSTFLRGDSTFAAVTSTTINSNTNNQVITATGTADTLQGESNLTFDGTSLDLPTVNSFIKGGGHNIVQVDATKTYLYGGTGGVQFRTADNSAELINITNAGKLLLGTSTEGEESADNLTIADSANCGITIRSGSSNAGGIYFSDGTSGADEYRGIIAYNHASNFLRFFVDASERFRIDSSGRVLIGTTTEGYSGADELTVNASGDGGITIRTGTSNGGILAFSDGTSGADEYRGYVQYQHQNDALALGSNGSERFRIGSAGQLGIGGATYGSSGQVLTSQGSSSAPTWASAGIAMIDSWRIVQGTGNGNNQIVTYWQSATNLLNSNLGSSLTYLSGTFSFPSTGHYLMTFVCRFHCASGNDGEMNAVLKVTENNSSYSIAAQTGYGAQEGGTKSAGSIIYAFDITDTSNQKFQFHTDSMGSSSQLRGDSTTNETYFQMIRLADT